MRRLLGLTLALASFAAFGQPEYEEGPYVGAGFGQLSFETEVFRPIQFDDESFGPQIFGGIRLNETFAIEGSYATHDLNANRTGTAPLIADYTANIDGSFDIFSMRVLAYTGSGVFFGIGYFDASIDFELVGNSQTFGNFSDAHSDSDNGLTYLIGGEIQMNNWSIRPEFEWVDVAGAYEAWKIGVGAQYKFH